ncbi:branched-chain amino acid aminotransferase [Mesobacillus campisalis]|uniref:Branched-chain amino acid aminotransferase n=1 Tax=Mesobacillus campisalis TaxID=1408103 RepID=A0A0M2STG5_9BACI|nr:branched chain amino acid aminotransferase [Mesobacillus campisalis]KKK37864.1 branched-chain amino acid aminotransferase [Mesobacillus campisalis]
MLKQEIQKYLEKEEDAASIQLFREEKEYAEKNGLLKEGVSVAERHPSERFKEAYIERGDKETENFLGEESAEFLSQPIRYFKENKNEFMYLETKWFDIVGVDAVSFEMDDVFGTYDVMLGLRFPKKYGNAINSYLESQINGEDAKFDLMFDANEGIWNLNFALNGLEGFSEELTIDEAYRLIYALLFNLADRMEQGE